MVIANQRQVRAEASALYDEKHAFIKKHEPSMMWRLEYHAILEDIGTRITLVESKVKYEACRWHHFNHEAQRRGLL
jgi:hypothetical protein